MTETVLLFAYGMIAILVLIGCSWIMRDIRENKLQISRIRQSLAWQKKRELKMLRLLKNYEPKRNKK